MRSSTTADARGMLGALLTQWGEAMLGLQVRQPGRRGLYGGLLCPACSLIHGRAFEVVHPFMYLARTTGNPRYVQAAVDAVDWADQVSCGDGSWLNEVTGQWKGTSIFGAIALGEALQLGEDLAPPAILAGWRERFRRVMAFLDTFVTIETGNINYPLTATWAFALAARILDEPAYLKRATELAQAAHACFNSPNLFIHGEGKLRSPRGMPAVDLGYSVEETLPALTAYARLAGDEAMLDLVTRAYQRHLAFMLPDGAWDNSWGTRCYKWSYWGSRTADGCQSALFTLAERDPVFASAALRNAQLYATCTHEGLLTGGPHYASRGESLCMHHSLCHAKALASALHWLENHELPDELPPLPRELAPAVTSFAELDTHLLARGPWRATVTGYDAPYQDGAGHPSGGTLSLLWHATLGPIFAAGMSIFQHWEPTNMQWDRQWDTPKAQPVVTPRLEMTVEGIRYASMFCETPAIETRLENGQVVCEVRGQLVDRHQQHPPEGPIGYYLRYGFSDREATLTGRFEGHAREVRMALPVIASAAEAVTRQTPTTLSIDKEHGTLLLKADSELLANVNERHFAHTPGFEVVPVLLLLTTDRPSATFHLSKL